MKCALMKILIVDDRPSNQKLLRAVLEADGATVVEAADGFEAVGALKRMGFDAIISDILMPRMDGYRLCLDVRASPKTHDLPFIAYTSAYTSPGDEKRMIENGADRFLRKPASAAHLTWTLRELVRARRRPSSSALPWPSAEPVRECDWQRTGTLDEKNIELPAKTELSARADPEAREPDGQWQQITAMIEARYVGERKRAESRRVLHHAVTAALADEGPASTVKQRILGLLASSLDADLAEWWTADPSAKVLHCTDTWHPPSAVLPESAAASSDLVLSYGRDLPGRVGTSGMADWLADIAEEGVCARYDQASRMGLPGWIGFPTKLRQNVVGVIGFFGRKMARPDAGLLALFETIGLQLGQFSESQLLASQLRQTQKMAALGMLAAGIAHDFNSSLVGIYGHCELAQREAAGNAILISHLDGLMGGAQHAAALARRIVASIGNEAEKRPPIKLRPIVADAVRLLRASMPMRIEIQTSLAEDAPVVLADATQVHRVLMNIGINAMHAMPGQGGRLTVTLESCRVDAELAATHPDLHAGPYARLTLRDNGQGMDGETLERIFEPFFTTKPPGEGTGIGLSIVCEIVQSHGGAVTVSSRRNEGTTFQVYFPAQPAAPMIGSALLVGTRGA